MHQKNKLKKQPNWPSFSTNISPTIQVSRFGPVADLRYQNKRSVKHHANLLKKKKSRMLNSKEAEKNDKLS